MNHYDHLCFRLYSLLAPDPLPLPTWDMESLIQECIARGVCEHHKELTLERWDQLCDTKRQIWIESTLSIIRGTERGNRADESQEPVVDSTETRVQESSGSKKTQFDAWPKQVEVAKGLGEEPMFISRLIKRNELKTNGETGHKKRIDPASVLIYCKKHGRTYNYT